MTLESIRRNSYPEPDRAVVEAKVVAAVEADPDSFIRSYERDPRSFGGRYIAADLFKEQFDDYRASKEARNRYNNPCHNAAAVLSAELLRRTIADISMPERDTVVFLTGIPGAGKTSSVLAGGVLPSHYKAIFEGQLSNPETTRDKIQQVLEAGLKVLVIAVHAIPENALQNTFRRFKEEGRGASIQAMSTIQGGLPGSLAQVRAQFGDSVRLKIFDYRDRARPMALDGWEHLPILQSEGSSEHIKSRLAGALQVFAATGTISDACYRQSSGEPPLGGGEILAEPCDREHGEDELRRALSPTDC